MGQNELLRIQWSLLSLGGRWLESHWCLECDPEFFNKREGLLLKSCLQILTLVFPFGFGSGRNILVIFILTQYNVKNHRPIAQ